MQLVKLPYSPTSFSAYGQSKAAINYTAKALSFELGPDDFIVAPIHPGTVLTDMLKNGIEIAPEPTSKRFKDTSISPETSATGIHKVIDGLTKKDSGKFFNYQGKELIY